MLKIEYSKIFFVFSDVAGANAILSIVDNLVKKGKVQQKDFFIFSDINRKYFLNYKINIVQNEFETIENLVDKFKPQYLFSATSFHNYEHNWRKYFVKNSIPCSAFIDHWVYYKRRFTFDNETVYPNTIYVINKIAKIEALKEGLPLNSIKVIGNPYYSKVKEFKPKINRKSFFKSIGIKNNKKLITFVSENIKTDIPKDKNGKSILGFDEYDSLINMFNALKEVSRTNNEILDFNYIIKIHPISDSNKFDSILNCFKMFNNIYVIKKVNPLLLNFYSDYICGMFSNMLIEALLMQKKVCRIQINQKKDLFKFDLIRSYPTVDFKHLINKFKKDL